MKRIASSFLADKVQEGHLASVPGVDRSLLHPLARRTTDMEGPHGKLCPRLTDGLSCNDSDGLPYIDFMPMRKVTAVTLLANPAFRLAG